VFNTANIGLAWRNLTVLEQTRMCCSYYFLFCRNLSKEFFFAYPGYKKGGKFPTKVSTFPCSFHTWKSNFGISFKVSKHFGLQCVFCMLFLSN